MPFSTSQRRKASALLVIATCMPEKDAHPKPLSSGTQVADKPKHQALLAQAEGPNSGLHWGLFLTDRLISSPLWLVASTRP
jgi:hypothetical protein